MPTPRRSRSKVAGKTSAPLKEFSPERQKLQPKLQMLANGSTKVNVMRAEM